MVNPPPIPSPGPPSPGREILPDWISKATVAEPSVDNAKGNDRAICLSPTGLVENSVVPNRMGNSGKEPLFLCGKTYGEKKYRKGFLFPSGTCDEYKIQVITGLLKWQLVLLRYFTYTFVVIMIYFLLFLLI